jgi:glycosyltransferase involved in cell wall biosynthesis
VCAAATGGQRTYQSAALFAAPTPLKLLFVTNTYPPRDISGVGALVFELQREARRRGHEALVLTRAGESARDAAVVGVAGAKMLFPLHAARVFARTFAEHPPAIVHVHESDGALVALAVRAARLVGRPLGRAQIVATLQVSYREERWAVRPVVAGGRRLSWPTFSEWVFAWLRAPILSALGRMTARLADAVIAPSRATALELARDYGSVVRAVIPNGVLAPAAGPPSDHVRSIETESTVLYVGRLRTRKAVAVLLEAMSVLAARRPDLRLVIAGDGEQGPALRRRAALPDLHGRVDFAGALPREAIADWYRRAAVLCLPSTYEGFPVTIVEAMAAGLPVVATRVAGVPEAVDDGRTGLLVPPEDVSALAAALDRLLEDLDLRRRMGRAAQAEFERRFTIGVVADAHLALYEKLGRTEDRVVPQRVSW